METPSIRVPPLLPFDPAVSGVLERLAMRAWPAAEVVEVDGWLVRRTPGVDRRRSNSAWPPAEEERALEGLDHALGRAAAMGVPEVVQVSPLEAHPRLDAELASRGWVASGATAMLRGPVAGQVPAGDVVVGELDAGWVAAWAAVGGGGGVAATAEHVLAQVVDRAGFAVARRDGVVAGVGIGVVEDGWLGLFSITVAAGLRRRGVGAALVSALGVWGSGRGARESYLQVEVDNTPALAFWGALGFGVAHRYVWRRPR